MKFKIGQNNDSFPPESAPLNKFGRLDGDFGHSIPEVVPPEEPGFPAANRRVQPPRQQPE